MTSSTSTGSQNFSDYPPNACTVCQTSQTDTFAAWDKKAWDCFPTSPPPVRLSFISWALFGSSKQKRCKKHCSAAQLTPVLTWRCSVGGTCSWITHFSPFPPHTYRWRLIITDIFLLQGLLHVFQSPNAKKSKSLVPNQVPKNLSLPAHFILVKRETNESTLHTPVFSHLIGRCWIVLQGRVLSRLRHWGIAKQLTWRLLMIYALYD